MAQLNTISESHHVRLSHWRQPETYCRYILSNSVAHIDITGESYCVRSTSMAQMDITGEFHYMYVRLSPLPHMMATLESLEVYSYISGESHYARITTVAHKGGHSWVYFLWHTYHLFVALMTYSRKFYTIVCLYVLIALFWHFWSNTSFLSLYDCIIPTPPPPLPLPFLASHHYYYLYPINLFKS